MKPELFPFPGYLTMVLFLSFIVGSTSCRSGPDSDGETEIELLDEFVILAYSGPPLAEVNQERYDEMAAAGIDVIVPGNGSFGPSENLKTMDLAQNAGIKVIPIDMRILPFGQTAGVELDTALVKTMVREYSDHPAFAGYVIRDEPGTQLFSTLGNICAVFREMDPGHEPLINLFPSYASEVQLGAPDFRTYIQYYIETVKPGVLSYDNYALREPDTWYDFWFSDLEVVRDETRKASIPFWVFIQSQGIREHMRIPNRAEILWQVNTVMAYGARGLGWFTYWTPETDQGFPRAEGGPPPLIEEHYGGMIELDGNPTPVYDYVSEANRYASKAGNDLIGWDNSAVARYEDEVAGIVGSSPILKASGEEANIVLGTFTRESSGRVMISNASCEKKAAFTFSIKEGWKLKRMLHSIDARAAIDLDPSRRWELEPGGSIILEFDSE